MSARPVLITGASGFAGSHLLDRLAPQTDRPIVGWHRPTTTLRVETPNIRWQAVDLLDRAAVDEALQALNPSAIYHVAGAPRVDTSWHSVVPHLRINVMGTFHLLDAVRRRCADARVLVVSSGFVYRPSSEPLDEASPLVPANPYALSKLAQDDFALRAAADGLDVLVARPFNHIGPRQDPAFSVASFARQIARAEAGQIEPVLRVGNLDARRDVTDVRDVAAAYEALMAQGARGTAYNVCSERAVRIGDLLDELLRCARARITVEFDPERMRASDTPFVVGSARLIRETVGWAPRFTLSQTLSDTLDWWRTAVTSSTFA